MVKKEKRMIQLLVLWGYLFAINACIGTGVLRILEKCLHGRQESSFARENSVPWIELAGVIAITVYAEAFSLFGPVGREAHLLLLGVTALLTFWCRQTLKKAAGRVLRILFSWDGALYLCLILLTALFASRGMQHTDTGIYHAQMIRWYEEYGVVKGLGNLQQHFAYNSASLAYAAFFSMKWLVGQSLHGTNGFLQAFMVVWAVRGLRGAWKRQNHLADGCRIAVLLYALVVSERIMSPATDFSAMYLGLWIVCLWADLLTEGEELQKKADFAEKTCSPKEEQTAAESNRIHGYALLGIAAAYVASCKLSAGCLVVLAVYPLVKLLQGRKWRSIFIYLLCGVLVLAPWLVRNVVISGWLLYPFTALDLFHVDWKIPAEYVEHDSAQIKVWGRCLYDVTKIDDPISSWLPAWWGEKRREEMMLLIGNAIAAAGLALGAVRTAAARCGRLPLDKVMLYLAVLCSLAGWFLTAPFIRYGLAFLLLLPCMVLGEWIRPVRMGLVRILSGFGCVGIFLCLGMFWDYYVLFDLVWVKQNMRSAYYVTQQDYDRPEVYPYEIEGGLTVYIPKEGDNISYHAFPGDAYQSMAERVKMRGDDIRDGFMTK